MTNDLLLVAHPGDLHITDAKQRNYQDFLAIAAQIETECPPAVDDAGRPGLHAIRAATPAHVPPVRFSRGSDAASIGAWPENAIAGTQLAPNRSGKPFS